MKRRTFLAAAIGAMFQPPALPGPSRLPAALPVVGGGTGAALMTGEIGSYEGFRFIETAAPRRMLTVEAIRRLATHAKKHAVPPDADGNYHLDTTGTGLKVTPPPGWVHVYDYGPAYVLRQLKEPTP